MAKQYTKCCQPADYSHWAGGVGVAAIVGIAIAVITGAWIVLAPTAMAMLVAFCEWWLYKRLVCLDGEKCVIGMLLTTEPVEKKGGFERFDTDFSINLVLAPHTIYSKKEDIESDGVSGYLIKEQDATKNIGLGFTGYTSKQWANYPDTPVLHAEFEGGGVYDLYQAAKAVLAITAVGAVVCSIPLIGWVACAVIMAIAAIVAIVGVIVALNDKGSPSDANADLTELHTNDPTGRGADILLVRGTWIYDSFHSGWNELHPILYAQKIGTWGGTWDLDAKTATDHWCDAVSQAGSALTRTEQDKPEHRWTIHPEVDGCRPEQPDIR